VSDPVAAREALIIEAIGEAANLIDSVSALMPRLRDLGVEINQASAGLRDALAAFETRMTGITETAKTKTVMYLAARTEEATRRSINEQSRAMADAARVALGAELGATMQRLQAELQPVRRPARRWESWWTHAATAAAASALTWLVAAWA
jgi:hypothetical protein